jgi:DNA-binding NtrC family response regulator
MRKYKVLLIEDDEGLWPLYSASLKKINVDLTSVGTASAADEMLKTVQFDLALVDYQLPDATGIDVVERYRDKLACVLVTAMGDESLVVEAMQKGGKDYVVKDVGCRFLELLPGVVSKAIQQTKLQAELVDAQKRMRTVFDSATDLMIVTDNDFVILDVGKNAARKYGVYFLQKGVELERLLDREQIIQATGENIQGPYVEILINNQLTPFQLFHRHLSEQEQLFVFQNKSDAQKVKKAEKVIDTINREKNDLIAQNRVLAANSNLETSSIIGFNDSILKLKRTVANVADTDANVLILGETGTGKELVANEIHCQSARKHMPMIKLNCASIPENLVESELFGHVKGAFTGAVRDHVGKFEQADGGSLFLDEIGELNLAVQAKLLRVLQEGAFEALGGSKVIHSDVRIIAATNRDLESMVQRGSFRADLFYRLNVIPIIVPPLRDRADDIILLANHFIERFGSLYARGSIKLEKEHINYLRHHDWPGNIRELQNAIERLVILGRFQTEKFVDIETVSESGEAESRSTTDEVLIALSEIEKQHIIRVLEYCHWRVSGDNGAAKILELNPSTLRFRMQKLGITKTK